MTLYPDVQKKAQAEILAVVGRDRLPSIDDRDALVYIRAIIKECLRWLPNAPLGVAHSTSEDDELCGYFIPQGTVILPNVWWVLLLCLLLSGRMGINSGYARRRACMHDEKMYEQPEVFRPERFIREDSTIDTGIRDPEAFTFGFGRRYVAIDCSSFSGMARSNGLNHEYLAVHLESVPDGSTPLSLSS